MKISASMRMKALGEMATGGLAIFIGWHQ